MTRTISLVVLFIVLAWLIMGMPAIGQVPSRYPWQCLTADGTPIYRGSSYLSALVTCREAIKARRFDSVVFRNDSGTERLKMTSPTHGVWTWVAPTALENGNILTDLSHFLVYRQPPGGQPAVWAQVDGKAAKLLIPMGPADYGACFWFVAVRKNTAAMPSDKSNTICLGATGLPLPAA